MICLGPHPSDPSCDEGFILVATVLGLKLHIQHFDLAKENQALSKKKSKRLQL